MILTFDIESSYAVPNFGRTYGIHITNERLQKQKNYELREEVFAGRPTNHYSEKTTIEGEVIAEVTMQNEAWSYLTGNVLGTRIAISEYKFQPAEDKAWGIVIGYVDSAITADATTITINEATSGEFDNVVAVIINNEFIKGSSSSGTFTVTERGSEGTTARAHGVKDLVYGVVSDSNRSIVLTCRKKDGPYRVIDSSLTAIIDRGNYNFAYTGLRIDEMTFNLRTFDEITTHMMFAGSDSTNVIEVADSSVTDENPIISIEDIKVYSEHVEEQMRQFYMEIHNNLNPGFSLQGVVNSLIPLRCSFFGVLTWTQDSVDHITQYESGTKRHFSFGVARENYRMIFAVNDVRINTNSYYLDGELIIQDSAPWYSFADPVIMYQF